MNHAEIAYIVKRVLTEPCEDTKELLLRFEKNIRDKENNMENEIIVVHSREPLVEQGQELLEAIDENDDMEEQFLTMECFEAINYHFTQTSRYYMSFTKGCMIKELLEAIDENDDKDEIMLTESVFKELEMIVKDI